MKKILVIIGLTSAILCAILSVLPVFKLAIFPGITATICGIIALVLAKKTASSTQTIQLLFLIVIMAFSLSLYKSIFTKAEVGNTEGLKQREVEKVEEAKEELLNIDITE
jgi:predicted PurR-regulated permease PerM